MKRHWNRWGGAHSFWSVATLFQCRFDKNYSIRITSNATAAYAAYL